MYLTIKHINGAAPLTFCLKNGTDEGSTVTLTDPMSLPVEGFGKLSLRDGFRWYLEEYPFEPSRTSDIKAKAVTRTLRRWGSESFNYLFGNRRSYRWYEAHQNHLEQLHFRVESESPEVLSWPWEVLCATDSEADTEGAYLGTHCSIERWVTYNRKKWALPMWLESLRMWNHLNRPETLRMLLVIARPFGERDVDFHAISRGVVDYVRDEGCPVEIDLLRPPTFVQLCEILNRAKEAGRQYHIVHFDGHGGYGTFTPPGLGRFLEAEGCLAFETEPKPGETVQAELVEASRMAQALLRCGVSTVVLNACQSAMVDERATSAQASVAVSLIRAGVPSVIAMGYKINVSGAKLFVPAFYKRLFRDGQPAQAMREGRGAMFRASMDRVPYRFQDWLVPQLYQSVSEEGRLLPQPKHSEREPHWENLHLYNGNVGPELDEYGLIGRGSQILELERLLHRSQAGILVYGMAGVGKTTLVRGFLRWLRDTGGLRTAEGPCSVVWFDFRDKFSASGLFEYLAKELMPGNQKKQQNLQYSHLLTYLKENHCIIVWDHFESVHIKLSKMEREQLDSFLRVLADGKSRVLLTSLTREEWLGNACVRTTSDLAGLDGEDLWDFCRLIAEKQGFHIDQKDKDLQNLLTRLQGNPMTVRTVLSRLEVCTPAELYAKLDERFEGNPEEEGTGRLLAAFQMVCNTVEPEMTPILEVLGLHEHFADKVYLEIILNNTQNIKVDSPEDITLHKNILHCFDLLEHAGLCSLQWRNTYRIHPILRSWLAQFYPAPETAKRWFVECHCAIENKIHDDEQARRTLFNYHNTNLSYALFLAKDIGMKDRVLYLLDVLAISANDRGEYQRAESLYQTLSKEAELQGSIVFLERANCMLAILAGKRGDDATCRLYLKKSIR